MADEENKKALPALVDVSLKMDKDDVAAILLSRAEEAIKKSIQECRKQETALQKQIRARNKEQTAAAQSQAEKALADVEGTLREAAAKLKCKDVETVLTHHFTADETQLRCALKLGARDPDTSWNVSINVLRGEEVTTLAAQSAQLKKELTDNKATWQDWRKKLADLPALERRAKAAVAEHRLAATDEGKALVEMLAGELDESLRLLGVG